MDVREDFSKEMILERRPELSEGGRHVDTGLAIQCGNSTFSAPEAAAFFVHQRHSKQLMNCCQLTEVERAMTKSCRS